MPLGRAVSDRNIRRGPFYFTELSSGGNILLETMSMAFRKARSVNQTSSSYVSKVPTQTEPSGDAGSATGASIIDLTSKDGIIAQNALLVVPFGAGSDGNTFNFRVIGWRYIGTNPQTRLWVPVNLLELACTLSAVVGVAGMEVTNSERFVDTISVTKGSTLSGEAAAENVVSPANDTIAHLMVDVKGFTKLELSFETGSSATNCNALIALL